MVASDISLPPVPATGTVQVPYKLCLQEHFLLNPYDFPQSHDDVKSLPLSLPQGHQEEEDWQEEEDQSR